MRTPRVGSIVRWTVFAATLTGVASGGVFLRGRLLPTTRNLPGLRVGGAVVDADTELRPVLQARATSLLATRVRFGVPNEGAAPGEPVLRVIAEKSLAELGVGFDVDRAVREGEAAGHEGDVWERADAALRARRGEVDVPWIVTFDEDVALGILRAAKEKEDTAPVSARLDLEHRSVVPEKPGRYVDLFATVARVAEVARETGRALPGVATDVRDVTVPVTKIAPRISSAFLADLDIHQVISQYDTYFSRHGDQSRRGKNIDVAASKVDGLVISPGEVMSFNELVGERSEENGFQKSWEIFKGEMKEGVGGGTCQVASTLHAVSFFGGLDVLERLPHSRPSAYIPMGLDSTVVFPAVDLKLKNPFPFPVVVHARVDGNRLHMELLGREKPATVSFEREVIDTIPFGRKVKEEAGLRGAKVLVKQHGIRGFKIKRTRTYVFKDGSRKKESTTDTYPPTTEIYEVPVGFDQSQLPELPDATDEDAAPAAKPPTPDATSDGGPKLVAALVPDPNAVQFVDAPGAHAPTDAQRKPPKTMTMRR